jgi:predicted RNA methylase
VMDLLISVRNRLADQLVERRLNIRTTGTREIDVVDAVGYSTFAYTGICRVLDRLCLDSNDHFVDVGCGKGRVVCAAALRSVRKVTGIEIDGALCEQARTNAAQLRHRRSPVEIIHGPAQEFNYRDCTAVFLFNPFNRGPLAAVLEAVRTVRSRSGAMRLAYVNPRFDQAFAEADGFERYDHWPLRPASRLKFAVSFWRIA